MLKKFRFCPLGPFRSDLTSDTLFGHLCWAWRYLYGEEALTELLAAFRSGPPPFLLSSAFPAGFLPVPVLPPPEDAVDRTDRRDLLHKRQLFKKQKKARYLSLARFAAAADWRGLLHDAAAADLLPGMWQIEQTTRVAIDRETGHAAEGQLYNELEYWSRLEAVCYVRYDDVAVCPAEHLDNAFILLGELGIGRNASTGKGRFRIIPQALSADEERLFTATGPTFITLSHTAGTGLDPLHYRVSVKHGRVGGLYAARGVFMKQPVIFLEPGSILRTGNGGPYGSMITGIHPDPAIVQYGYAFPLYFGGAEV